MNDWPPCPSEDELEPDVRDMIACIRGHTMVTLPRLISLVEQVRHCESAALPGAFVECGVWKAGCTGLMALANLRYGKHRRDLHLFDAFTEICEPDATIDGDRAVDEFVASRSLPVQLHRVDADCRYWVKN